MITDYIIKIILFILYFGMIILILIFNEDIFCETIIFVVFVILIGPN